LHPTTYPMTYGVPIVRARTPLLANVAEITSTAMRHATPHATARSFRAGHARRSAQSHAQHSPTTISRNAAVEPGEGKTKGGHGFTRHVYLIPARPTSVFRASNRRHPALAPRLVSRWLLRSTLANSNTPGGALPPPSSYPIAPSSKPSGATSKRALPSRSR